MLKREQTQALALIAGLKIPEGDLDNVTLRLSALLESMEAPKWMRSSRCRQCFLKRTLIKRAVLCVARNLLNA